MPIIQELRENGHILFVKFSDPWTVAELEVRYTEDREIRDVSRFLVHSLVDVTELRYLPSGFIPVARRTPAFTHPKRGEVAVVGASIFVQRIAEVLILVTRAASLKFFRSHDEALVYLRQVIRKEEAAALASPEMPAKNQGNELD
jgi:hypothetical protein